MGAEQLIKNQGIDLVLKKLCQLIYEGNTKSSFAFLHTFLNESICTYSELELDFDQKYGSQNRMLQSKERIYYFSQFLKEFKSSKSKLTDLEKLILNNNPIFIYMFLDYYLWHFAQEEDLDYERPVSDLGTINYYIVPRKKPSRHLANSFNHSGCPKNLLYWNNVNAKEFKGFSIKVKKPSIGSEQHYQQYSDNDLKVLCAYFEDSDNLSITELGDRFYVDGCADEKHRMEKIEEVLEFASRESTNLVVFPELTISIKALKKIKRWLALNNHKISYVVAGSQHTEKGSGAKRYNNSKLLDNTGTEISEHSKFTNFTYNKLSEAILLGNELTVLKMPFGISSILICKDFCDKAGPSSELLKELAADFLIVPTMGNEKTLRAHDKAYRDLKVSSVPSVIFSSQNPPSDEEGGEGRIYPGPFETSAAKSESGYIELKNTKVETLILA